MKSVYVLQHAFSVVLRNEHGDKITVAVNTFKPEFAEVEKRFEANWRSQRGWSLDSVTYVGECVEVLEQDATGDETPLEYLKLGART